MGDRFIVTPPVRGGNAWWQVHDTQPDKEPDAGYKRGPNALVADIYRDLPGAEGLAQMLCDRLNGKVPS